MTCRALFLLIAYRNMDEVDDFVDHVRESLTPHSVVFSICDNSPVSTASRHEGSPDVFTATRPDNPGYLDGGLEALENYRKSVGSFPDWVFLSNTDLLLLSPLTIEHLCSAYDADDAVIVAPRITEGDTLVEKNPHVPQRHSSVRLRANHLFTATPTLAMGYLLLSVVRRRLAHLLSSAVGARTRGHVRAESGEQMYSPYGAIIIFSRGFWERHELPKGVPLLAEEFAIAETAARHRVPIIFDSAVQVHHEPHTTTGPDVTWRRARLLSDSFRYIYDADRLRHPHS